MVGGGRLWAAGGVRVVGLAVAAVAGLAGREAGAELAAKEIARDWWGEGCGAGCGSDARPGCKRNSPRLGGRGLFCVGF